MQALTPEQLNWLRGAEWDILRSAVVASCALVVHRLAKSVRAIRPGIVSDVAKAVATQMQGAIDEHKADDKRQFAELKTLIQEESEGAKKEFHLAMQEHIATLHRHRGATD